MQRIIFFFLFFIVTFTWGTTWLAMKIAGESISPMFATGLRFLAASPFLLIFTFLFKKPFLFSKGERSFQLIICIFYFAIPYSLMIYGELSVSASLAAIIFSMMPATILIFSTILFRDKINVYQCVGLIVSTITLCFILINESNDGIDGNMKGGGALICAVFLHALMYIKIRRDYSHISVLTFNSLPCLGAGILLSLVGWYLERPELSSINNKSFYAVLYLGGFAGVFGILSYFLLQKQATSFQASIVFYFFL
ncbi:TPA: DMT family transporter [Providencia rettgeri]